MAVTLIFPCSVPAGERFAEAAKQRGERIVAASSLRFDETAKNFETWFYLPSVHSLDFVDRLKEAIAQYGITQIFCPVLVAWVVLSRLSTEQKLSIPILGEMPTERHTRDHRKLMNAAMMCHRFIQSVSDDRSKLSVIETASVLHHSSGIYGESDQTKIAALMAVFADAPRGDVVEIGVLAGKSVWALATMARRHGTGAVLAIDPWRRANAVQHDSPVDVQTLVNAWEPGILFESFLIALMPFSGAAELNYLALPSREAYALWSSQLKVTTPEFGDVAYTGKIAVLHVDGNHDYARVREDCELWLPHLVPGGWLVLDDYFWLHGDGPRRVGDELLEARAPEIHRAFSCGKALFIKFCE